MLIYIKIIIYFVILRGMIIWNVFIPNLRTIFHPKHFNKLEIKKIKNNTFKYSYMHGVKTIDKLMYACKRNK